MNTYALTLTCVGAAVLGAALLPLLLAERALSFPILYVALGCAVFSLPLQLPTADPLANGELVEQLTGLVVIVSLTGAGLKLDRPFSWREWLTTRRLLVVAMPLTIAGTALLGRTTGLATASALLLGAVLAPTDPVLAGEVQVGPPGGATDGEDDVRFALTSEAGLNDGLAFPFTNAAIAIAAAGSVGAGSWFGGWLLDDVILKLVLGLAVGLVAGRVMGLVVFRLPSTRTVADTTEGFVALAIALLVYGVAELCHGYGFISVFVAACVLRAHERDHDYHEVLHASAESIERVLSAALLVLLGGAVIDGALAPLGLADALVGLAVVLVVRPVAGMLALVRTSTPRPERRAIAFFGIRGVGSVYYLAYALNRQPFDDARRLWTIVAFTIVVSVVIHGVTATPAIAWLDARRDRLAGRQPSTGSSASAGSVGSSAGPPAASNRASSRLSAASDATIVMVSSTVMTTSDDQVGGCSPKKKLASIFKPTKAKMRPSPMLR